MSIGVETSAGLREKVAEEVRVLLARKRMSGAALAAAIGKSEMYVSRRMRGEIAFDLDDLQSIAAVLKVQPVQLFGAAVKVTNEQVSTRKTLARNGSTRPRSKDSARRSGAARTQPSSRPNASGRPGSYPHSGRRPSLIGYQPTV